MNVLITDPCYVLTDEQYQKVLDRYDETEVDLGDFTCIIQNTYTGDGVYSDQFGNEYMVDSGQLCIVPLDKLSVPICEGLGHVFDTTDWDNGWYESVDDGGSLVFGDVVVYTGVEEEEEEV